MPSRKPGVNAPEPFRQQLLDTLPRLRRYARSLSFDHANADDLVQTTAERALAHWHQFDQRRDIRVWLLSIAHNAHLDRIRREQRYTLVDPDQLAERREAPAPGDPGLRMDLLPDVVIHKRLHEQNVSNRLSQYRTDTLAYLRASLNRRKAAADSGQAGVQDANRTE